MKKTILSVTVVAAVALTVSFGLTKNEPKSVSMLQNLEAMAAGEINPDCPNGCHDNGLGCYCYGDYPTAREHVW